MYIFILYTFILIKFNSFFLFCDKIENYICEYINKRAQFSFETSIVRTTLVSSNYTAAIHTNVPHLFIPFMVLPRPILLLLFPRRAINLLAHLGNKSRMQEHGMELGAFRRVFLAGESNESQCDVKSRGLIMSQKRIQETVRPNIRCQRPRRGRRRRDSQFWK